jgi:glycosyltransferase involved in cell wall biosynthesis
VPVYNGENFLALCLEDLAAQDYPNIEIIIADNGSTDGTGSIADAFARRYANVTVVHRPENIGAMRNFEDLVERANGEFFFWAAADDRRSTYFTSRLVEELLQHTQVGVMQSALEFRSQNNELRSVCVFRHRHPAHSHPTYRPREPRTELSWIRLAWAMAGGSAYFLFIYGIFRTQWLRDTLPFPRQPISDMAFMLRYALRYQFGAVDDVLYFKVEQDTPWEIRLNDLYKLWGGSAKRYKYAVLTALDLIMDYRIGWLARAITPILFSRMLVVAFLSTLMQGLRWAGSCIATQEQVEELALRLKRVPVLRWLMGF